MTNKSCMSKHLWYMPLKNVVGGQFISWVYYFWNKDVGRLRLSSIVNTLQTSPQKPLGQSKPNFMWSLIAASVGWGKSLFKLSRSCDQNGRHPIYGKNPSKIFSRTKGPMTLGLAMHYWGLGSDKFCSNDELGWTLNIFMSSSNLLPYVFVWENLQFFRENVRKSFDGRNNKWPEL